MDTLLPLRTDAHGQTIVPQARGKAAAFDTYVARGGKIHKRTGKYRKGPMKGKTYDETKQQFEGMWAGVDDSVKEKYAGRSRTDLAPSELAANQRLAGISPTPKKRMSAPEMYADQREKRMARYPQAAKAVAPKPTAPAPGSDAARAAALTEASRNERYNTADSGDGGMRAALAARDAAERGQETTRKILAPIPDSGVSKLATNAKPIQRPYTPPMGVGNLADKPDQVPQAAPTGRANREKGIVKDIMDAKGDMSKLHTDDRMWVQGKTNDGPTPVMKEPSQAEMQAVQATSAAKSKFEPLDFEDGPGKEWTGISKGRRTYSPAAKPTTATDAKYAGAKRMMEADGNSPRVPAPPPPPRAIPIKPTPEPWAEARKRDSSFADKSESAVLRRANDESAYQANIAKNPVEMTDDERRIGRKMFTGRIKPLGQASAYRNPRPI